MGRQFVYWANGLVLAEYMDGGIAELTVGKLSLQLLGGVTTHDTIDIDSYARTLTAAPSARFTAEHGSAQLGKHKPFFLRPGAARLEQRCPAGGVVTASRPPITTRGTWALAINGSIGDQLLYGMEFVYEGEKRSPTALSPDR